MFRDAAGAGGLRGGIEFFHLQTVTKKERPGFKPGRYCFWIR